MDLRIDFDAFDFSLDDMGDHHILNFWHGISVEADILFLEKEPLKELYKEMVKESGKPEVSFADNFEPIEPDLGNMKIGFTVAYDGVQVFSPTEVESYWCLIFDDDESSSQVAVRFGNDLARRLISKLASAIGPHQHEWSRIRIYMGVDHVPSARELEECRRIISNPETSFEEKRTVLEKLGCQVIIGEGEGLSKGTLIRDFDFCNCGVSREACER